MSIKIIHTADNHIGISYNTVSQAKSDLVKERLDALKRIVDEGNKENANYLVIAGDLFDVAKLNQKRTSEVIKVLDAFKEKVVIIPGNHDFYIDEKDSLWNYFKKNVNAEKILVLDNYEVYVDTIGDQEVRFYPAGCRTLHSDQHMIGWVSNIEKPVEAIHIGIAHGNVVGLGRDEDGKYFNMHEDELKVAGVDFWLLGHIHVAYPTLSVVSHNPGYFMSGTHMPDSWKSTNVGNAWIIEVDENKAIKARQFQPSPFSYKVIEKNLQSTVDIDSLKSQLAVCNKKNTAVRLNLNGRLADHELQALDDFIKECADRTSGFIHFEINKFIKRKIDIHAINNEFVAGSLPHILLTELLNEDPDGLSTQKAFEAIFIK
ncbi:exonuclease SbcCD subunit D [Daejeonella sp.]|jgi:exonuclease SbcD|uniref:exonuclease SbcCD subunit D n=1 Tax=Daejeonella sp. TaxID=2805397 RepID=UPI0037C0217D